MRARTIFIAALTVAVLLPLGAANAEATCNFGGGSAEEPQLADPAGDWDGAVTGNEAGLYGDVNRESGDLLGLWFDHATSNRSAAHVTVGSLADPTRGSDANLIVYVVFDNPNSKLNFKRQFVSATFNGRGSATYNYGDVGPDPTTGINTFTNRGGTTGKLTTGSPAQIDLDIKWSVMGQPLAGSTIDNIAAQADFLVGANLVGGFLQTVDDTANGEGCFESIEF